MIDFHQVGKDYYDWENFKIDFGLRTSDGTPTIRNPGIGIGFKNPADSMDWEPISKHFKNFSLGKWGYINGVYIRGG